MENIASPTMLSSSTSSHSSFYESNDIDFQKSNSWIELLYNITKVDEILNKNTDFMKNKLNNINSAKKEYCVTSAIYRTEIEDRCMN